MIKRVILLTLLLLSPASSAWASLIGFSMCDPLGDATGEIDVTAMDFSLDSSSGNYEIILTASSENPFSGSFRININLLNLGGETGEKEFSFFQNSLNDYALTGVTERVILTGTSAQLHSWDSGDRILMNNLPDGTPHPDRATYFRSCVIDMNPPDLAFRGEDMIGIEKECCTVRVASIPEPSPLLLLGTGGAVLVLLRRSGIGGK